MILNRLVRTVLFPFLLLLAAQAVRAASVSETFTREHFSRLDKLFSQLDPAVAPTGEIRLMWFSGRHEEAASALADYYAEKPFPLDFLEPAYLPEDVLLHANAALEDRFFILEDWETMARRPDGHYDWDYRGTIEDKEVSWMLNRHPFLPILAQACTDTGREAYREKLNALLKDWILANPYPKTLSFSPSWRALEVARRILNSWLYVFYGYRCLDPEVRLLVLSSVLEHADSLHHHASFWGGNHLISEKLALLAIAHAWPEFKDAQAWKADAVAATASQFLEQTYPDGSYKELSNHYQRVVLVNAQMFMQLLAAIDPDYESLPVVRRIEAMWNFFFQSMRPDGFGPLNNASDREHNADFVRDVWESFDRPDWLYMATNGSQGNLTTTTPSAVFPWAGQIFIRDSWQADADWIYLDAGPYGTAHQHADRMHVSAALNGKPILVDNGRYTYKPSPWREYFKGPESHNVILLDGEAADQAPREVQSPLPLYFVEQEPVIMAAAKSRFSGSANPGLLPGLRGPIQWIRAVLYDKRGFVIIVDHLVTFGPHEVTSLWNFHPDIDDRRPRQLSLSYPGEAASFTYISGREEPPLGGFHSPDYNVMLPSTRLIHEARINGPATFVWILQDNQPDSSEWITVDVGSAPGSPELHFTASSVEGLFAEVTIRLYPEPQLVQYTTVAPD